MAHCSSWTDKIHNVELERMDGLTKHRAAVCLLAQTNSRPGDFLLVNIVLYNVAHCSSPVLSASAAAVIPQSVYCTGNVE